MPGASRFWCYATAVVFTNVRKLRVYSSRRIALSLPIMDSLILGYFSQENLSNDHCCVNKEMGKDTLKQNHGSSYMYYMYLRIPYAHKINFRYYPSKLVFVEKCLSFRPLHNSSCSPKIHMNLHCYCIKTEPRMPI